MATIDGQIWGRWMRTLAVREGKCNLGRPIDTARAEPVAIEKNGRPVVGVVTIEE